MGGYHNQTDHEPKGVSIAKVREHSTAVKQIGEGEEAIDVEQPRRNLQGLGLHAVKPLAKVQHCR
ncbi:MAG: hypothetical protein EBT17_02405 [Actinobacteria bacterium]|nr:hypothetical protein [Actinomycetota bacterium]